MKAKQKWYDLPAAKELLRYTECLISKRTDKAVYRALQTLESQQDGLCKAVVATHRAIARITQSHGNSVHRNTVGPSLLRLEELGVLEYEPGDSDYSKKKASKIRRRSITEIEKRRIEQEPAHRLAKILNKRWIQYGSKKVKPKWRVAITNRLYAREPDVQNHKALRPKKLAAGCKHGQVLVELDFKAAEPSVIAQRLGEDGNGYEIIAQAEGINRDEAKEHFNAVAYARSTSASSARAVGWRSQKTLAYFQRIDSLRKQLRRPNGKPVREVKTELGETIKTPAGKKCFAGTLLSYYAQGSIAGFINRAALRIIKLEKERGWRFVIPCHDSVYVIAKPDQIEELAQLIQDEVAKTDLRLELKKNIAQPNT